MRLPILGRDAAPFMLALWYLLFWSLAFVASCRESLFPDCRRSDVHCAPCSPREWEEWPEACSGPSKGGYEITETASDAGKRKDAR